MVYFINYIYNYEKLKFFILLKLIYIFEKNFLIFEDWREKINFEISFV